MHTHRRRDLANRQQRTVGVRPGAVARVVADRQPLVRHPEDDLGADHVTGQSDGMHLRAGNRGAAGLAQAHRLFQRHRGLGFAHPGQAKREFTRGTTGCIGLVVVGVVDDLPLRDQPGRGFGKLLQQHHGQREVAAGEHAALLFAHQDLDLREARLRESGGGDHAMRTMFERGQHVTHGADRLRVFAKNIAASGKRGCGRRVDATAKPRLAQDHTRHGSISWRGWPSLAPKLRWS